MSTQVCFRFSRWAASAEKRSHEYNDKNTNEHFKL